MKTKVSLKTEVYISRSANQVNLFHESARDYDVYLQPRLFVRDVFTLSFPASLPIQVFPCLHCVSLSREDCGTGEPVRRRVPFEGD